MKILVVGGAGYIGSHMVLALTAAGHQVLVIDDLSTGFADAVIGAKLEQLSLADPDRLDLLFSDNQFDAVMHFASFIQVGESVIKPAKYYRNNLVHTLHLLDTMVRHKVSYFIFSSTAAIFGQPQYTPIDEQHPKQPINPYGHSKLMVEQILSDYEKAYDLKSVCLRYFNAAGADPQARAGERHEPETHLIPLLLQVASGRREAIHVFGRDYDTPDGTCIRDYVHVSDLADAHLLALEGLIKGRRSEQYNLGNGQGFSVQQVIDAVQKVTGKPIKVVDAPRRAGDPAILVADANKAKQALKWQPQYPSLETIVQHAWRWEQRHAT